MAADKRQSTEIAAGLVLIVVTVAALAAANSPWAATYKNIFSYAVSLGPGDFAVEGTLKDWIKNGLMAVFFLLVGLELKSEFKEGVLSNFSSAVLPFIAAAAGMFVPAIIYLSITGATGDLARGWAIPGATDIAFAVGVIGLLGSRVPPGLKALLLAIAVIDDLGAILIIAVFYTADLNTAALALSALCIGAMAALNASNVQRYTPYVILGGVLWICLLKSGVNPTLAGVAAALFVPLGSQDRSPLHDLANAIKWPVSFLIMPIFAFANAGAPLGGFTLGGLAEPLTAGVLLGLLIGKPLGVTLSIYVAVRLRLSALPEGVNWGQILGAGFIAGIGFTMSLFIGALAFPDEQLADKARLGTLTGSFLAAIVGAALLFVFSRRSPAGWVERVKTYRREIW